MEPAAAVIAAHRTLDEIFARFRELVVLGDGAAAAAVLAVYRALTVDHAAAEEAHLVPGRGPSARWPDELYVGQHGKLVAAIDRVADRLAGLTAGAPGWRRRALAVLDAAAPLHHLAEHHHAAEEQDLFVTAAPAALAAVAERFAATLAVHAAVLAAADARLGA